MCSWNEFDIHDAAKNDNNLLSRMTCKRYGGETNEGRCELVRKKFSVAMKRKLKALKYDENWKEARKIFPKSYFLEIVRATSSHYF